MTRTKIMGLLAAAGLALVSMPAFADVAPDECEGAKNGTACELLTGKGGVCKDDICVEKEEPGTGGGGGSGSGAGGGSGGGASEGGGSAKGDDAKDDGGGCSVRAVGARTGYEAAGLMALAGACALVELRRRRRN